VPNTIVPVPYFHSRENNYEKESKNNMDRWIHCGGFGLLGIDILVFHKPTGQADELENLAFLYVA
jgi:hypothetical protein